MSRPEAVEAYAAAHKKALKAYREAMDRGRYPYPPVLEEVLVDQPIAGRMELGVLNVPISDVVGTFSAGRRNAFTSDFLPLLEQDTEFGAKWITLCEAHLGNEGIRDPIRLYEYYGKFYVQEGNKRLSVLRWFGAPTVPASVQRIVPMYRDDPATRLYYAFLAFYQVSRLYEIRFQKPEQYPKLVAALGFEPDAVWTDEQRQRVRSAFILFSEAASHLSLPEGVTVSDAFLAWVSDYSIGDVSTMTSDKLLATLKTRVTDLDASVTVAVEAPEAPTEKPLLSRLYDAMFLPTHLSVAFIHEYAPEASPWVHAHEAARLEVQEALKDRVKTQAYTVDAEHDADALFEQAIHDGAQVLFATTPSLIASCRRTAAAHPNVKILNCSVAMPYPGVRTYYSRIYESKFLSGVIAGTLSHNDRLGYIAPSPIFGVPASINAFALGARLVNPRAVVKLRWSCTESDPFHALLKDGVDVISNREPLYKGLPEPPMGLCRIRPDGTGETLAAPYWDFSAFYLKLLTDILSGHWEDESANRTHAAVNYWWGLLSGVIGISLSEKLPEGVKTLVEALRLGIVEGRLHPFRRVMSDQSGIVRSDGTRWFTPEEILHMDWLLDTVEGGIPAFHEILPMAQSIVRLEGVYRDAIPPVKEGPIL